MPRQIVGVKLGEYFAQHPNIEITTKELEDEFGFSHEQIRDAIANAHYSGKVWVEHLEEIVKNRVWIYRQSNKSTTSNLYEEITKPGSNVVIVSNESGDLFRLTPIV